MRTSRPAAYFDTSVLLKRYVREPGTDKALVLMRRHPIVTAAIAPLEMFSALRRLEGAGNLKANSYRAILKRIQADRQAWDLVAMSVEILLDAERAVRESNIRAMDAIHVASAVACQSRLRRRLSFVTGDISQREAALRLDLEVIWIE